MDMLHYLQETVGWFITQAVQCTREPSTCVTTVQFWVAIGSGIALIVGFARWLTMKVRKTTIDDRLGRIEAGTIRRQRAGSSDDCELVRAHRTVFTRPGFMISCIGEVAPFFGSNRAPTVLILVEVINETIAALGTGRHFDAKGQVRGEFADLHGYRRPEHRKNIALIYQQLQQVQWHLKEFEEFLQSWPAVQPPHKRPTDPVVWSELIDRCDRIDTERNKLLGVFNRMLQQCGEPALPLVPLSSSGR